MSDQGEFRTRRGLDLATAAELGDLLHELSANKETRKIIAGAIRKAKPDSQYNGSFKDVEIEERFEELKRASDEDKIKSEADRILERMGAQKRRLMEGDERGRKYSAEEIARIEALMQSKGLTDYDDGATLYAATLPPDDPKPSSYEASPHGTTWEFPEWAKFGKDPVGASREVANQVITEFMRKRGGR